MNIMEVGYLRGDLVQIMYINKYVIQIYMIDSNRMGILGWVLSCRIGGDSWEVFG